MWMHHAHAALPHCRAAPLKKSLLCWCCENENRPVLVLIFLAQRVVGQRQIKVRMEEDVDPFAFSN